MGEVAVVLCACNCGKRLNGSRRFFPGHKPARTRKTPEERSEATRKMWDARGRTEVILNPCACGCGEMVKGKWAWGHHSRVENISKRDDVKQKRSEMFHRLHEEGKLGDVWNKELTKDVDERIAAGGAARSASFTFEERAMLSEKMKEQWKQGNIVPLTGSDHPAWKGGTSSIAQRCRGSNRLYKEWKYPILSRDKFSCRHCNKGSTEAQLAVHHDQEKFATVVKRFIPQDMHQLSWDEETEIVEKIFSYHIDQKVSGITLCYECHEKVHSDSGESDDD